MEDLYLLPGIRCQSWSNDCTLEILHRTDVEPSYPSVHGICHTNTDATSLQFYQYSNMSNYSEQEQGIYELL